MPCEALETHWRGQSETENERKSPSYPIPEERVNPAARLAPEDSDTIPVIGCPEMRPISASAHRTGDSYIKGPGVTLLVEWILLSGVRRGPSALQDHPDLHLERWQ